MKKIICFILILSFIFPFLPLFNIPVSAASVSSNSSNAVTDILQGKLENALTNDGIAVSAQYFATNVWNYVGQSLGLLNATKESVENYLNGNELDADSVFNTCYNTVYNNIVADSPYYIYRSMPVSQFFTFFIFNPSGDALVFQSFKNWLIGHVNNDVDTLCGFFSQSYLGDSYNRLVDYSEVFEDYTLCLYGNGSFDNYPSYDFQTYIHTQVDTSEPYPFSILKFYENNDGFVYSGYFPTWSADTVILQNNDSFSHVGFVSNRFYPGTGYNFYGTIYLSPDSVGSIAFPVFRSSVDLQMFYKGQSDIIRFDSNIHVPSGTDIDYSNLFKELQRAIQENSGNLLDSINNAANVYLSEIVNQLSDTKDIVQNISNFIITYYPLFSSYLDNIRSNLDLSNDILKDIDDKLGFMIDFPLDDATPKDFEDMRNIAAQKFPFCIFSDIVAISVILNRQPVQPDINILVPVPMSESDNYVHIDLSPYEYARPYVHGALIFLFIIGLIALSIKVFDSVKS